MVTVITRVSRSVLQKCSVAVTAQSQAGYRRKTKEYKFKREAAWMKDGDALESLADFDDWISREDQQFVKDIFRNQEQSRKKVLAKILERKHFKKEQETNLLTWNAKQQMRFLNQEYPEEWTVDRLATSFPVSREGVIKVLKSSFVPQTEEIIKHDARVKKNWLALVQGPKQKEGPVDSRCKQLLQERKIHSLQHAAGNKTLPAPDETKYLCSPNRTTTLTEIGPYESIVKDYYETKKRHSNTKQKLVHNQDGVLLKKNQEKNLKLLDTVTADRATAKLTK